MACTAARAQRAVCPSYGSTLRALAHGALPRAQGAGLCEKLTVPSELLDKTDVFIFDCDGVIWKGDTIIDGVPAILDMLRAAGKKIFFVTNNSTKSRKGYLGKFKSLGLDAVEAEEIFSSSFAAAAYLEQTKFKETGKKVYIIGEVGIEEELDLIGVPWIGGGQDAGKKIALQSGYALPHDENVGAVIVGFDREINYHSARRPRRPRHLPRLPAACATYSVSARHLPPSVPTWCVRPCRRLCPHCRAPTATSQAPRRA